MKKAGKTKAKERPLELGSTAGGKADVNGDFRKQDQPRPSLHAINMGNWIEQELRNWIEHEFRERAEKLRRVYCLQSDENSQHNDHLHICANKKGHCSLHRCKADVTGFKECGHEWGFAIVTADDQYVTTAQFEKFYAGLPTRDQKKAQRLRQWMAGKWRT